MTKLLPNEIACKIPGVTIVQMLPACMMDQIVETIDIPAKTSYGYTADKTFQEGKTYFIEKGYSDETLSYEAAEVTVGDKIPPFTYFEETSTEAITGAQSTTIYECYTDGKWVDTFKTPDGGYKHKNREHPIEIIRTQCITYTKDGKTRSMTIKSHGEDLWSNRETAKYVPIHQRIHADKYGESGGVFRM